jgi:hypothetical protein
VVPELGERCGGEASVVLYNTWRLSQERW